MAERSALARKVQGSNPWSPASKEVIMKKKLYGTQRKYALLDGLNPDDMESGEKEWTTKMGSGAKDNWRIKKAWIENGDVFITFAEEK